MKRYYPLYWTLIHSMTLLLLYAAPQYTLTAGESQPQPYTVKTIKSFEDVIDDLKLAISEANFRLTSENRIGSAISKQTGKEFPQARILHFCNLETARIFLEAEPDFLLNMPCRIAVRQDRNQVIIQTWLQTEPCPELSKAVVEVNSILKQIVHYGAE